MKEVLKPIIKQQGLWNLLEIYSKNDGKINATLVLPLAGNFA